jgi:hypothetical protein
LLSLGEGSRIATDPLGEVHLEGDVVIALGAIEAPAGRISVKGDSSFPIAPDFSVTPSLAVPTVYFGPRARLSAKGTAVLLPDPYGRRAGILHHGGDITVEGNILAEAGAVLDVSGASASLDFHPSRLGLSTPYATAGLTTLPLTRQAVRQLVSSDGGRIEIETHAGTRSAWLTPGLQSPVRLRLRDLGLPARGSHRTGHLFVTLFASEVAPSAAEDMLARFTRVWTPDRLAA